MNELEGYLRTINCTAPLYSYIPYQFPSGIPLHAAKLANPLTVQSLFLHNKSKWNDVQA